MQHCFIWRLSPHLNMLLLYCGSLGKVFWENQMACISEQAYLCWITKTIYMCCHWTALYPSKTMGFTKHENNFCKCVVFFGLPLFLPLGWLFHFSLVFQLEGVSAWDLANVFSFFFINSLIPTPDMHLSGLTEPLTFTCSVFLWTSGHLVYQWEIAIPSYCPALPILVEGLISLRRTQTWFPLTTRRILFCSFDSNIGKNLLVM